VDVVADMQARAAAPAVFRWVDDLSLYPRWLDLVSRAEPSPPHPDDEGPAWSIDLRARLGPLARAKRLRMVRVVHDAPHRVEFARREHDGRQHSPWVLRAEVDGDIPPDGDLATLRMHLHYGGGLFGPVVERLLTDEIERARPRLVSLIEDSTTDDATS
jgi:hypothetical protein